MIQTLVPPKLNLDAEEWVS